MFPRKNSWKGAKRLNLISLSIYEIHSVKIRLLISFQPMYFKMFSKLINNNQKNYSNYHRCRCNTKINIHKYILWLMSIIRPLKCSVRVSNTHQIWATAFTNWTHCPGFVQNNVQFVTSNLYIFFCIVCTCIINNFILFIDTFNNLLRF